MNPDKTIESEAIPIVRDRHFRPQLAEEPQKSKLLNEIQRRNQLCRLPIESEETFVQTYNEQVRTVCRNSRKALWKNLGKRFFGFKPVFWPQLLMRPIQRRLGTW